ncbi:centromere DNA-binding protein complex CBF3 subunit A [Acrasis kona]|uniref:Centromere DNA-binding protein complex CBF3 subunit A n=1 Tax=Acrasis kona TaxID=1008807 RepID=A0AAW2YXJ8_9EUKA
MLKVSVEAPYQEYCSNTQARHSWIFEMDESNEDHRVVEGFLIRLQHIKHLVRKLEDDILERKQREFHSYMNYTDHCSQLEAMRNKIKTLESSMRDRLSLFDVVLDSEDTFSDTDDEDDFVEMQNPEKDGSGVRRRTSEPVKINRISKVKTFLKSFYRTRL